MYFYKSSAYLKTISFEACENLRLDSHMLYPGIVQHHILKAKSPFSASAAPRDHTRKTKTGKHLLEVVSTAGFVVKLADGDCKTSCLNSLASVKPAYIQLIRSSLHPQHMATPVFSIYSSKVSRASTLLSAEPFLLQRFCVQLPSVCLLCRSLTLLLGNNTSEKCL